MNVADSRSPLIDLLRGISAQAVVCGHVVALMCHWSDPFGTVELIIRTAVFSVGGFPHQAVMVFFAISGYLVGGGVVIGRLITGRFSAAQYAIDRLTRLWTVLIPALILGAALDFISLDGHGEAPMAARPFFPPFLDSSIHAFFCNAVFLQGLYCDKFGTNLSLWSLACEAMYYIAFPLVALIVWPSSRVGSRMVAAALLAIAWAVWSNGWNWGQYRFLALIWLLGVVAWIVGSRISHSLVKRLLGAAFFCAGFIVYPQFTYGGPHPNEQIADLAVAAMATGLLISRGDLDALIRLAGNIINRGLRFLSDYSYSLFVVHLPVVFFLLSRAPSSWWRLQDFTIFDLLRLLSIYAACNIVAIAFYLLFERHYHVVRARVGILLRNRIDAHEIDHRGGHLRIS